MKHGSSSLANRTVPPDSSGASPQWLREGSFKESLPYLALPFPLRPHRTFPQGGLGSARVPPPLPARPLAAHAVNQAVGGACLLGPRAGGRACALLALAAPCGGSGGVEPVPPRRRWRCTKWRRSPRLTKVKIALKAPCPRPLASRLGIARCLCFSRLRAASGAARRAGAGRAGPVCNGGCARQHHARAGRGTGMRGSSRFAGVGRSGGQACAGPLGR